ncbi:MAG: porin [Gammaproteobacteria bacterium]
MKKTKNLILPSTITALITAAAIIPLTAYGAKAEFSFSGQISRAISQVDNGIDTDTLHVDNNNSGTRLRLKGQTDLENGNTAGVYWETQYQDNSSSSIDVNGADNPSAFTSRIREVWFSGDWGKVYLGQGNGAANGTSEVDFSGTSIADYSGNNLDDGISFVSKVSATTQSNGGAFSNFDGLSRNDRLRYDLPKFGAIGIALSSGQERFEVALRYSGKIGDGGKLGFALGQVSDDAALFDQLGISASVLLASGINVTVHVGDKDNDTGRDPSGTYIKVGKKTGQHNFSVSFHSVDDNAALGDEAERTNLSYVYNMAKYGVELFGTFQTSSLTRTGENFEDVTQIAFGSRIKF